MTGLFRIFKFAFQDIGRNLGLSLMTVFILILMLLSVNTLITMNVTTGEAVRLVKDQINVSLYLKETATDKNVKDVQNYVASFPQVVSVKVQTREEVLASFQTRHQFVSEVLQGLAELGGNPFGPIIIVKANEPGDYRKIVESIEASDFDTLVETKSFEGHEAVLDRIQAITTRIERIGFGLAAIFAIISFLIIFNTVRVAIHTQRVEISIKRLVGANNWFIRGPYLVESLIFTLISVIATMVIMYFALQWLDRYVGVVFPNGFSLTKYYNSHMLYVFGLQTLAVLALTVSSSILAMRRQLKV